ncbi:RabGAP/TBC [Pluteus cervinus]|uniref:RabGAP/TBC n=1 Tax=Pluteus cervinus TaxID=181527 RepID=A0ACD3AUP3_9AGAR|nr:RabGAP/TBC [Pluteus cervinus]
MTARPPPARPHIGLNPSIQFPRTTDWAEDDAWDSTSDSESTKPSTVPSGPSRASGPRKSAATRPDNSSSSTLSSSYTHLQAPNPGSWPPVAHTDEAISPQNGWTIVKKSPDHKAVNAPPTIKSEAHVDDEAYGILEHRDADVEGDMILGELESEAPNQDHAGSLPSQVPKAKQARALIREDADDIVNDPLCGVKHRARHQRDPSPSGSKQRKPENSRSEHSADGDASEKLMRERSIRTNRRHKFVECLSSQDVNIVELRKQAWSGIPSDLRPMAWQLLLGSLPLPTPLRSSTLARKRKEYLSLVELTFARGKEGLDQQIWHQIEIDVPRTRPGVQLWMYASTQRCLERILYVWAIRHPASGYVQGINDLVTPFFQVFLSAYIDSDPELFDPSLLPSHVLNAVEADSFWCLSRLLDGIQDNYIFAQPGIQRSVRRMAELVARIDAPLYSHLESQNVEFMQFAFRWMNCLLMREISVQNTIRMWDTYLAEGPDAFSQFHLYVCCAFLVRWSEKLRQMDFQGIIMFLQSLPTQDWGDHEIEMLLSEAFVLNSIWHNAQSHFNGK